jgi:hypothetical protein
VAGVTRGGGRLGWLGRGGGRLGGRGRGLGWLGRGGGRVRAPAGGLGGLAGDYGAGFVGQDDGLDAVAQAQLGQQVTDVRFDRGF